MAQEPNQTPPAAGSTAAAGARSDITSAEVDALLDKNKDAAVPAGTPQPYDLVARDKIVRGRMPVLDRLNERWVTEFQRKLTDLIRQPVEVSLQQVQLAPYGDWLAAQPMPTSLNLCTVKPWPRSALVAVEGKLLFALVEKYYGGWQRGYVPPQIPTEPEQTEERHVDVTYDGQTLPILMVAYKLPAYDAADRTRVAADLFADLAFGETSEAYRRLVLDEQVVEDIDAGASYNRDPGLLEIYAHVKDPEKVEYVLGVIDETIDNFRAEPPDAARLADLQKRLRYGFLMGLQTPDDVASHVAQFIALSGDLEGLDQLYATFAAITPDDVQMAAERYLAPERRTIGVLRPRP